MAMALLQSIVITYKNNKKKSNYKNNTIIYCLRNPEGAVNYTFLQSQLCVKKMRRRRHPKNPSTIEELIDILSHQQNSAYGSTMQNPSSK